MRAIIHKEIEGLDGLHHEECDAPGVEKGKVKVQLKTAGLNRRDLAVTNRHKVEQPPLILGSDGAGIIAEVGEGVTGWNVGDEVVINPGLGWKHNSDAPPQGFEILGLPDDGTFAEYIVLQEENIEKKPSHLTWEQAGVLPLAALTAYRVLFTRAKIKEGDTILLPGIGSGVLTFALKFAKAAGAKVIVTSRSEEKLETAKELGADLAIPTLSDWEEELAEEQVDVVVESIGQATFEKSLGVVRRGGTVVTFGATTEDKVEIDIRKFFYGQYNLLGSTMGSREEFQDMLSFITDHSITPEVDKMFALSDYQDAFAYIRDSKNFGKIGFTIS
ncbi:MULTISPECIES: zinc-binding dehydrogenase [Pontibacillus]|uniref:Zinc-binding dehydrogenase n=1 Tax=Pontibacillus chungwhensis TaxID=265426 RepID=A0ABY8V4V8_9BACI|nr:MULTISPECIES: zinc-binding dehydrogenase [Pontibacillus]MCD5325089.1 zinc-binding dehydrogenase [Pontibacillus sp. HN14]WIG00243.1 zinc-binding dehydrogenase [Pontibacillus chungwhensis]